MSYEADVNRPLTTAMPYFPPEEQEWLQGEFRDILNGKLAMGPRVERFETEFAAYCGTASGIAFPNGTAALESTLAALDVGAGDEVLVPTQTFIATGMAVFLTGARPVFTEVSAETMAMDFDDAWSRVSERTKGAIVVHFGGVIDPGLPPFVERMRASGRFVIEDAAHAHGAELGGRFAGSLSDAGCFSFYSSKLMTTGEGGMVVTSDDYLAGRLKSLQNRGMDLTAAKEVYNVPSRNNRVTEISAAMGISQLRTLPDFLRTRRQRAAEYGAMLRNQPGVEVPDISPESVPAYWRFLLLLADPSVRATLRERLAADGIPIDWPYEPPLHLQPVFMEHMGTEAGMLPKAEALLAKHFCVPIHAQLRKADVEFVCERLGSALSELGVG